MSVVDLVVGGLYKWVAKEEVYDWGKAIPGWVVPEPFVYVVVLGCIEVSYGEIRIGGVTRNNVYKKWEIWNAERGVDLWSEGSKCLYGIDGAFMEVSNVC